LCRDQDLTAGGGMNLFEHMLSLAGPAKCSNEKNQRYLGNEEKPKAANPVLGWIMARGCR